MAIVLSFFPHLSWLSFIAFMIGQAIGNGVAEDWGRSGKKAEDELASKASCVAILAVAACVEGPPGDREKKMLQYAHREILGPLGYGGDFEMERMLESVQKSPIPPASVGEFLAQMASEQELALQSLMLGVLYAHGNLTPARRAWLQGVRQGSAAVDWSMLRVFDRTAPGLFDQQRQECYAELSLVPGTTTVKQIKDAYRKKASQYHLDKFSYLPPQIRDLAQAKMAAINAAYHALMNDQMPGTMPLHYQGAAGYPLSPQSGEVAKCWLCGQKNRLPSKGIQTSRCGQCSALLGVDFEVKVRAEAQPVA
jgi:hypothetical protein